MMAEINYHNKDRLFRFIFGNPENKAWTVIYLRISKLR